MLYIRPAHTPTGYYQANTAFQRPAELTRFPKRALHTNKNNKSGINQITGITSFTLSTK